MLLLAGEIVEALVYEHGPEEFLRRIADPCWFQALACVLGFDWHSSGTTTVTTGALKMALSPERHGIAVAGGKGKTSTKAPQEIQRLGEAFSFSPQKVDELLRSSKMAAKVDNALVQDGYQLYHHAFFFTERGEWAVVQQGMNQSFARRYHWLSDDIRSFVETPHSAICSQRREAAVLDLTAVESRENREATLDLVKDGPAHLRSAQRSLLEFSPPLTSPSLTLPPPAPLRPAPPPLAALGPVSLSAACHPQSAASHPQSAASPEAVVPELIMPARHELLISLDLDEEGRRALQMAYELQPESYEELVALRGLGPKRIRALSLISELIYGAAPSWRDPARFSFAHGGKDGTPFPVDRETYEGSIQFLQEAVEGAMLEKREKLEAIKRLRNYAGIEG
jgi:hypothetical protein